MRALPCVALALLCGLAFGQSSDSERIFETQSDARYVTMPRLLVEREVEGFWLSPDGKAVIALTSKPAGPFEEPGTLRELVYRWIEGGENRVLAEVDMAAPYQDVVVAWTTEPGTAFITYRTPEGWTTLLRAGVLTRSLIETWRDSAFIDYRLIAGRGAGGVALLRRDSSHPAGAPPPPGTFKIEASVYTNGGDLVRVDAVALDFFTHGELGASGDRIAFVRSDEPGPNRVIAAVLDLRTGRFDPSFAFERRTESEAAGELLLASQPHEIKLGEQVETVPGLWLQASDPPPEAEVMRVLVTTDATRFHLSDSETTIAFVRHGALYASRVDAFSLETLRNMRLAAERTEELQKIKQVATALLIYASDNDDVLPGGLTGLDVYLRDTIDLSRYTFHLQGQDLTKLDNPSETEMISVRIPGGRMVSYADTTSRWIPDK